MSVPNLPQNPCPRLDERAVEAAARQRFHEAMRGDKDWTWASVTEDTREAYRETERHARAAYFAALDPKHDVQRDVEEFHRVVVGIPDSTTFAIRRPGLRAELIREEARETVEAIERGDLIEAIDGMCDLLCVVYGTAAEFGINLAPFWDEVHRTNMAKAGGPVREDGKRLKPDGWQAPDIARVLGLFAPDTEEPT